ncbi:MAG: hypothetical protein PF450_16555 [Bacteroidales bacterium]|jgi:hypothetical protein|nr:hypothetical protein [Bacteroidales bacterium]
MKYRLLILVTLLSGVLLLQNCGNSARENSEDFRIAPINFKMVKLQDGFWKNWVELTRDVTIPFSFAKCEETGRINNFIFAGDIQKENSKVTLDSMTPICIKLLKELRSAWPWMTILKWKHTWIPLYTIFLKLRRKMVTFIPPGL